jgi:ABC-type bacteriocin/lantibiotic exporter with double-glycine peptidase domain
LGNLPPREAREKIAYLPQSILLFSGSLLDNLKILSNGASRSTLLDMAEETGLADLVRTLPMGWETVVAQGGYNFSGGQRQLVALTAVMASRRQVLLLDEAMANLDPLWKERLLAKDLFQGKTVLLASHEDSRGRVGPEVHGFRPLLLCEGKA